MKIKISSLLTVDFFYLLFLLLIIPPLLGVKSILDLSYFVMITYCYVRLKIYSKR